MTKVSEQRKLDRAEQTRLEIVRLCLTAIDARALRVELLGHIRTIVPFEYAYFTTTDPATGLGTSTVVAEEPPDWCMPTHLDNEYLQDDFCKFSDMVRRHQSVQTLSESTGHKPERSQRYHDLLRPLGMEDELRTVFVSNTACWGTLCLHRERAQEHYTSAEAGFLARLAPHITDGLRRAAILPDALLATAPDGPGVLILEEDGSVVAFTGAAEYWLAELLETERADRAGLPTPVGRVVAALKAIEHGQLLSEVSPKVRLQTPSGRWLLLQASWLRGAQSRRQISVVFEVAQPTEILSLIMLAYSLTKREIEVTQCVLRGLSTHEIAGRLVISPLTVQDHLKSIFNKVDVASRGELAARLFMLQHQA